MGFGKEKNKVKLAIVKWNCEGQYGYGQGRGIKQFGEDYLKGRSVCDNICKQTVTCRGQHFDAMDEKYPAVTGLVREAVLEAKKANQPIIQTVVVMMRAAANQGLAEAVTIQEGLKTFGIDDMTDHYVYGQLANIQRGLNGERNLPRTPKPVPETPPMTEEHKKAYDEICELLGPDLVGDV